MITAERTTNDTGKFGLTQPPISQNAISMALAQPPGFTRNVHPREYIPTPNRHERRVQFGIDCAESVHFTHWEPGGEHVKQLVVKNVVMKTQKIKYKLPQTRYFSMEFPETMTLSAGMSWTVPITFRPVAKEGYNDVIEFTTTFGKFYLPIKATLPEHVLDFPSSTDFYLCPIRETARNVFLLKNVGELASYFEWATEKPFAITPRTGMLEPGGSVAVTIEFKPENASVYTAIAVCTFGDKDQWEKSKVTQAMTIEGIGKFSHLTIEGNVKEFDFGDVFVGHTAERKFVLVNSSAVHANFRIKQAERDTAPYFEFSTLSGTVAEGKSVEVTVTYTPVAAGMRSTDYFDITTLSGNTIRITCTGVGIGPKVTLNTKIINFNDVPAGTTVTRALYIQNNAATTAFYQFLTEPTSIFRIDKPWGTINPLSSVALTVKFSPMEPLNYWRRVYCLVEHQDGLYLDILGTCYNDKRRPATFFPKHIENYQKRKRNGLWSYGPEQLEEMIKSGAVKCENGVLSFTDPEQAAVHASLLLLDSPYETGRVGSEYFYENVGDREAVTLVDTYVDFGACSRYRVIESQFIRIANNTKGKMSCVWIMPGETTGEDPIFNVQPKTADIPPKTTFDFRVNFRPKMDNSFYGAQLECFVYFKSMRNFRLVNEDTFTPPWCLTPMVAGNTFPPGEDTFIPKINFGATRLDFPSCHVDKSVYRTVRVSNTGDTPVKFAILDGGSTGIGGGTALASAGGAAFSVKPRVGLLHKNESRLIVFRFSPSEQRIFEQALKCLFNSSSTNSYDLQMRGVGYYPQISFDTNNMLCFRPTCIGAVAKRPFTARNTSRISVHFEWHIPLQYASFVSIEPTSGTLLPNKTMDLMCTFAPNSAKNWVLKLPCYYSHETDGGQATQSHEGSPDFSNRRSTLTVVGQGTHGRVVADPSVINLDAILVNTIVERDLVLYNPCDCDVFYTLEIARRRGDLGERGEKDPAGEDGGEYTGDLMPGDDEEVLPNSVRETGLEIIQSTKVLPARSNQTLRVRVCLTEQLQHEFRIYYRLEESALDNGTWIRPMSRLLSRSLEQQRARRYHLCNIIALGVHPLVQVRDIRCEGFGKTFLWQLFSLDRFNDVLQAVGPDPRIHPADEDDSFPTDTGPLSNDQLGADTEVTSVNFDFGAAPVGCKPTVYHFSFMNTGVVSVDWVFQFPNDLEVEIEHWADPGDYTDEQMHHNLILDNNIFSISPKSGRLDPGESVHVIMTYSHEFAGQHKLPVVFKLRNGSSQLAGKEIMLNFAGYSVPPTKKCLHFHSTQHAFKPVSIGTEDPPVQSYQLTNRGPVSLEYYVDLSPLEKLKAENHNVDIIECRTTSGIIPPGGVTQIDWIFRPLEVRDYEVDIPISVVDGKTRMITFQGRGIQDEIYDSPEEGRKKPRGYEDPIPPKQLLTMPRQLASLSRERIVFGHVPLRSCLRDLLVVTNVAPDVDLSFRWIVPECWPENTIKITPASGLLRPGQSRLCKVVFTPNTEPRVYESDVICEIRNETEQAAYDAHKEAVETARREGRSLSVGDISASTTSRDKIPPPSTSRASSGSQPNLNKMKYRALPGISPPKTPTGRDGRRASGLPCAVSDDRRSLASSPAGERKTRPSSGQSVLSDSTIYEPPPPPEPFQLFVAILARTYLPDEFQALFTGYGWFFRERRPMGGSINEDNQALSDSSQRSIISSTLSSILDDVMQDPEVQGLPDVMRLEPLPYFAQISTRKANGIVLENEGQEENDVGEGVENKEQGGERISGDHGSGKGTDEVAVGVEESVKDVGASAESPEIGGQKENDFEEKDAWLLSSSEFHALVETVIEGTIYNIVQEANAGEFEITRHHMAIVQ